MRFVCSAVVVYPKNSNYPIVACGRRHWNCFEQLAKLQLKDRDKNKDVQGFIVATDRDEKYFVNRQDGAAIAKILGYDLEHDTDLFSEDIWKE